MKIEKKYIKLQEEDIHPAEWIDKQLFIHQIAISHDVLELWHKSGMIYMLGEQVCLSHYWSITELQILVSRIRYNYREWLMHRNRLDHLRILIVEDDSDLRHFYQLQLQKMRDNRWIDSVSNGAEALFSIGALKPDIIICDLKMPGMDGFHMLEVLADSGYLEDCKKIVITGLPSQEKSKLLAASGSLTILSKPVDFRDLEAVINTTMIKHKERSPNCVTDSYF